jgi:hypothetical protein
MEKIQKSIPTGKRQVPLKAGAYTADGSSQVFSD